MSMYRLFLILAAAVLIPLGLSSVYTVDRTEFVYLTHLGQHVATLDGEVDGGLHFKWPWPIQSVQSLDRRLQYFDLPETEVLTFGTQKDAPGAGQGQKNVIDRQITVVPYVCWRIADSDGVDYFIRRVGNPDRAQEILGD